MPAKAPVNVAEMRERVLQVIAERAEAIAKANADEASKGHMAQMKYLFEVLGIYPATASAELEGEDSNDLARVLLKRFEFPYKGPADEGVRGRDERRGSGSGGSAGRFGRMTKSGNGG